MNKINYNEILQGMFIDATEGIIVSNSEGRLILSNPKALQMFGYTEDEMYGLKIEDLIPSRYRPQHTAYRDNYYKSPAPRNMGAG
ncbi:MAG: PAS domain-containing protein, partial [Chitinophagaceae bacterium]